MTNEPRRFYRSIVHYEVLSEEPIPVHSDLAFIGHEVESGQYVGCFLDTEEFPLNSAAMAKALFVAGSEPSFFELDAEGNDFDEDALDPTAVEEQRRDEKRGTYPGREDDCN